MEEKLRATKERLFGGIDLHKSRSVIYLMDEEERRVSSKRIPTKYESFRDFFSPYLERSEIAVAIETGNLTFTGTGFKEPGKTPGATG